MTKVACRGCQAASLKPGTRSNAETNLEALTVDKLLSTMQIVEGAPLACVAL